MKFVLTYRIEGQDEKIKTFLDEKKFREELHRVIEYTKWVYFRVKRED